MDFKGDIVNGVGDFDAFNLQGHVANMALTSGKFFVQCTSHDHVDNLIHIGCFAVFNFTGHCTIAKNSGPVTDLFDFLHAV